MLENNKKKTKSRTKPYQVWQAMLSRCYNENNYRYKWYGAIGVTVCDEWRNYDNFKLWYDENYIDGFEIDKDILCDKFNIKPAIYSPDTCMFTSKKDNVSFSNRNRDMSGEKNNFYGKKHTLESRKKISDSLKGKKQSREQIENSIVSRQKKIKYYETHSSYRWGFLDACKKKGWNFNDFVEVFSEYRFFESGVKKPRYFYFLKQNLGGVYGE